MLHLVHFASLCIACLDREFSSSIDGEGHLNFDLSFWFGWETGKFEIAEFGTIFRLFGRALEYLSSIMVITIYLNAHTCIVQVV